MDQCEDAPCENGGQCYSHVNMFVCKCLAGFLGRRCELDIDECISTPCLNGGTCFDLKNMYRCECLPGYQGVHCEILDDPCENMPCENGGKCITSLATNEVVCKCAPGYLGLRYVHMLFCGICAVFYIKLHSLMAFEFLSVSEINILN